MLSFMATARTKVYGLTKGDELKTGLLIDPNGIPLRKSTEEDASPSTEEKSTLRR